MASADGKDISGLLSGNDEPVREIAVTECPHSKAVRWRNWRFVHFQPDTFGEDVGELYDLDTDPLERVNLYHDPEHQDLIADLRRKLLVWLIKTTRIRTGWGIVGVDHGSPPRYPVAGDGRLPTPVQFGSCRNYE